MQFDGNLADAKIECDLLVKAALCDFAQDFALARRQLCVAVDVLLDEPGRLPLRDIFLDRSRNRVEERLISYRLRKEVNGSSLDRLHRHRDVTVTREEDDRSRVAVYGEMLLEVQPACSRHANIEDQATGAIFKIGVQ